MPSIGMTSAWWTTRSMSAVVQARGEAESDTHNLVDCKERRARRDSERRRDRQRLTADAQPDAARNGVGCDRQQPLALARRSDYDPTGRAPSGAPRDVRDRSVWSATDGRMEPGDLGRSGRKLSGGDTRAHRRRALGRHLRESAVPRRWWARRGEQRRGRFHVERDEPGRVTRERTFMPDGNELWDESGAKGVGVCSAPRALKDVAASVPRRALVDAHDDFAACSARSARPLTLRSRCWRARVEGRQCCSVRRSP